MSFKFRTGATVQQHFQYKNSVHVENPELYGALLVVGKYSSHIFAQ